MAMKFLLLIVTSRIRDVPMFVTGETIKDLSDKGYIIKRISYHNPVYFKSVCTNLANTILGSASDCRSDTWRIICRVYHSNVSQ